MVDRAHVGAPGVDDVELPGPAALMPLAEASGVSDGTSR
jgi:hypothetical protein